MRNLIVEAIGAFFLVTAAIAGGGLAAGFMLAAMIFAGGHISGGHYNPAVSIGAFIRGRLDLVDLGPYIGAQLVGGGIAGVLGGWFFGFGRGALPTFGGEEAAKAFVIELIITFALAYTMLNVATSRNNPNNHFYGLAIGAVVIAGGTAFGAITGGAFNPAVGLGATISGAIEWGNIWVYFLACPLGGALAGLAFKALNPEDV